ncbi:MAG TPA: hypothetical protein PLD25_32115 [Chloroflexota bacterium]|nr:hypothetical protein [Chloroflexota bacterium]HUM68013.1 hypothetical protein [Chloroflexota bacterium]
MTQNENKTNMPYQLSQPNRLFARTNRQTIWQRAQILRELGYWQPTIAEICCGDCQRQQQTYQELLQVKAYCGLDINPAVVALNQAHGVACVPGDALDVTVLRPFARYDVLFFGPPLSVECDGHTFLPFQAITPGFAPFAQLLVGDLAYDGLLVCIGPSHTNMGDIQWLYHQIRHYRPEMGLRLIHYSHATLTGMDEPTEMRLKYVEFWFLPDSDIEWEVRVSQGM